MTIILVVYSSIKRWRQGID